MDQSKGRESIMAMQGVYRSQASPTLTALPPGLMGLYTQGAKSLAEGIEGFGEGIADAISSYKEGQEKREFNTKEFEALQEYADDIRMKGQYESGEADSFPSNYTEEFAKTISKFNDMSTSQQEGAISGMKFKLSRIEKDRAFEEDKRRSREREWQGRESLNQGQQRIEQGYKFFGQTHDLNQEKFAASNEQFKQRHDLDLQRFIESMRQGDERMQLTRDQIEAAQQASQATLRMGQRNAQAIGIASGAIPLESNYEHGSKAQADYQWNSGMRQATDASTANIISGLKPEDESKVGTEVTLSNKQQAVYTSEGQLQLLPFNKQPAGAFSPEFMEFMEGEEGSNFSLAMFGNDADYSELLGQISNVKDHKKAGRLMETAVKTRRALMDVSRADDFKSLNFAQKDTVETARLKIDRVNRMLLGEEDQAERKRLAGEIIKHEKEIADVYAESKKEQAKGQSLFQGGVPRQRFNLDGTFENLNK